MTGHVPSKRGARRTSTISTPGPARPASAVRQLRTAELETGQYTEGDYGAAGTVRAEHEAETDEQQSPRR
jgi:hypothetical protein